MPLHGDARPQDRVPDYIVKATHFSAPYPKDSEENRLLGAVLVAVPN
jgi:hypothetical protein